MAKISISQIFEKRRKIRLLTGFCVLILLAVSFEFLTHNPKAGEAALVYPCAFNATDSISANDSTCENQDVVIRNPGTVVTIAGHHTFKSLTISDHAVLTHEAFAEADIISRTRDTDKEIYINTTGDVKIQSGASIKADGRGYLGGTKLNLIGKGPNGGGGSRAYSDDESSDAVAGGGANGGNGGSGADQENANQGSGGTMYDYSIPPTGTYNYADSTGAIFQPGSGGGAADGMGVIANGGAGGGRIKLIVGGSLHMDNDTSISANGEKGSKITERNAVSSGGGAGGSIILQATSFTFDGAWYYNVNGGVCDTTGGAACDHGDSPATGAGGAGREHFSQVVAGQTITVNSPNPNILISAVGGDGVDNGGTFWGNSGSGGGGFISITSPAQNVTIQKTLTAVNRNNANPKNKNFNPYALQIGDQILVTIKLSNTTANQVVTVTDTPLALPNNSHSCVPDSSSSWVANKQITIPSNGVAPLYTYTCTVK